MIVAKPIHKIQLEPGSKITIPDVTWDEFETILEQLGKKRRTRIAYSQGILEIMVPLPEHERPKVIIADLIKLTLKQQKRSYEPLGSTTFKREITKFGLEPDDCFYIQNYKAVIGKDRLDLNVDPPPDLAIEVDLTSKTKTTAYETLGVPELWIYAYGDLTMYHLESGSYQEHQYSLTFPNLPIKALILKTLERAKIVGFSQALDEFETELKEILTGKF